MMATRLAVLVALCMALTGCSKKDSTEDPAKDSPAKGAKPAAGDKPDKQAKPEGQGDSAGQGASETPTDRGDFRPVYGKTGNPDLEQALRESKMLEGLATELNSIVALPRDVTIELLDCGEPNAFYSDQEHRIAVCYELIELFDKGFAKVIDTDEEIAEATIGATLFTFFHELGHALVHELGLPITGKEEDAVDQLATVVLLAGGDDGALMALDGAESFLLEAAQDGFEQLPFWDEHSLDEQRFYNIVCLVYGSNPDAHGALVESGDLPEERAERCPDEYKQVEGAWDRLLAPHML